MPLNDTDTEALTAIMSRYQDARARIISAESPLAGAPDAARATDAAPAGWALTVPVDVRAGLPSPHPRRAARAARASSSPAESAADAWRRGQQLLRSLASRFAAHRGPVRAP